MIQYEAGRGGWFFSTNQGKIVRNSTKQYNRHPTDIPRGDLFRHDPRHDDHERVIDHDHAIGGFTVQDDGELLLFQDRGRIQPWSPTGWFGDPVVAEIPAERDSRFNDVVAGLDAGLVIS